MLRPGGASSYRLRASGNVGPGWWERRPQRKARRVPDLFTCVLRRCSCEAGAESIAACYQRKVRRCHNSLTVACARDQP